MIDLCAFRDKLKRGETVLGTFSKTCDPAFVEASGYAGFEYIILDLDMELPV